MRVDLIDTTSKYIPLALFYLKSYAETDSVVARGSRIEIVAAIGDVEATCAEIVTRRPEVIGFSCYIWNMLSTMELCRHIKEALPDTIIVTGGPDVSSVPEKALATYPWIDLVVRGEGEETFRELLHVWVEGGGPRVGPELEGIQGLAFRRNGEIVLTDRRPFIDELDVIPSPYLNGCIDLGTEKRTVLFETYRGCPFKCSFCYYPKDYGKLLHSFTMERVEHDLKQILGSGIDEIFLMDPTFNIPPKRAKEILRLIARHRRSETMSVTVELRVDLIDREFMDLLKEAGISMIEIGLQSTNEDVLRTVDRKQSTRKITENVRYLQSIGIDVVFQLIYGLPDDTYESFLDTIDFCVGLDATKIEAYRLQLLPGTPMYRSADLLGLNFNDTGERKIISTRTMTAAKVERAEMLAGLVDCFFNDKAALESLKWLAHHLGASYARLLDRYIDWRLQLGPAPQSWTEEGARHLDAFIASLGVARPEDVMRVVSDLRRYDFHTSPIVETTQDSLVHFDFDIETLRRSDGSVPAPQPSWLLFHRTGRVSSNFFNGRVIKQFYRVVPADVVFGSGSPPESDYAPSECAAIARWHLEHGDLACAEAIGGALAAAPGSEAEGAFILGSAALERGDPATAVKHLKKVVSHAPRVAAYQVKLGNALLACGEAKPALAAFRKAVELDPDLIEARFNLGVLWAERGRLDRAADAFRQVVERQPGFAPGHFSLGEVLRASGRLAEAAACYERALALFPDYTDAREALVLTRAQLGPAAPRIHAAE